MRDKGQSHPSICIASFSNSALQSFILATVFARHFSLCEPSTTLISQSNALPSPSSFTTPPLLLRCAFCQAPISLNIPNVHTPHLKIKRTADLLRILFSQHQCGGLPGGELIFEDEVDALSEHRMRPAINSFNCMLKNKIDKIYLFFIAINYFSLTISQTQIYDPIVIKFSD